LGKTPTANTGAAVPSPWKDFTGHSFKAIFAFFKELPRKIWRIPFVDARANKSLQRTAPVPRLVMPLAVCIEFIAARKRFIVYHVYSRGKAASVTPTLGSGRCR